MKKISVRELFKTFLLFFVIGILAFSVNIAFAASPFTWVTGSPANTDAVNIFPALYRSDIKTVIGGTPSGSGGILGTLQPYGTANTGFRENQVNDDSWICQNAYATSTTVFNRDNTATVSTLCATEENSISAFRWLYSATGANPITFTEFARLTTTSLRLGSGISVQLTGDNVNWVILAPGGSGASTSFEFQGADGSDLFEILATSNDVNRWRETGAPTGGAPTFITFGSDTNVPGLIATRGTGAIQLRPGNLGTGLDVAGVASAVDGFTATPSSTGNPATVTWACTGTDTNCNLNLVSKGTGAVQVNGVAVVPTTTVKRGSAGGNYTTTSASYVDIDATNLALTVTIPTGQKMIVTAAGSGFDSSTAATDIGIFDSVAAGVVGTAGHCDISTGSQNFIALAVITGDGASHTIKLQFKSNGAQTLTINNSGSPDNPQMTFFMTASN